MSFDRNEQGEEVSFGFLSVGIVRGSPKVICQDWIAVHENPKSPPTNHQSLPPASDARPQDRFVCLLLPLPIAISVSVGRRIHLILILNLPGHTPKPFIRSAAHKNRRARATNNNPQATRKQPASNPQASKKRNAQSSQIQSPVPQPQTPTTKATGTSTTRKRQPHTS